MNFKKKQFALLLCVILTLTLQCSVFHAINLLKQGSYTRIDSGHISEIPFHPMGNLIMVPITFEKDPTQHTFILDLGAGSTVVDSALCDSMKLIPQAEVMSAGSLGKGKREKIVVMPTFNFGQYSMKNIAAVCINLTPVSNAAGMKIAGIIGTNAMKHFQVFISYRKGLLKISDSTATLQSAVFSLPMKLSLSTSFLPLISGTISLNNKSNVETDFEIDNGLNGWLMVPKAFIKKFNVPNDAITKSYGEPLHDAYKGQNISLIRVNNVNIGKLNLEEIPAFVTNFKYPAIGKNVLECFDFMIDYPANRVNFYAISDSARLSFAKQPYGTGIVVEKMPKGNVVKGIWEGSQADKSSVKVGDEIVSINGSPVDSLSSVAVNSILNEGSPSDSVNVVFETSDGKHQIITLIKSIYLKDNTKQ